MLDGNGDMQNLAKEIGALKHVVGEAPAAELTKPQGSQQHHTIRHWLLHTARLDHRIGSRAVETLSAEEVFTLPDLAVLRKLPRFSSCFTAVTAEKIAAAIDSDPLVSRQQLDPSIPSWLEEAGKVLESTRIAGVAVPTSTAASRSLNCACQACLWPSRLCD